MYSTRTIFCLFLLVWSCRSAPQKTLASEISAGLTPYDFAQKTPEKIAELLTQGKEDTTEGAIARYVVAKARLDWLLYAWLTGEKAAFERLAEHVGLKGCGNVEEKKRCLQEIPKKIIEELGELNAAVSEASALKSLLSALQSGPPGSAVQAAGLQSALKKEGEVALRAQLVKLATVQDILPTINATTRDQALELFANSAPFTCTHGLLAVTPGDPNRTAEAAAPQCGYACTAHNNGRVSSEDTPKKLFQSCTPAYYGLEEKQEHLLTKRNFIVMKILNDLGQALLTALKPQEDPLLPLVRGTLGEISKKLESLRFFAGFDLNVAAPILENTELYPVESAPYLYIQKNKLSIGLWPTLSLVEYKASLREGPYAFPGKELGAPEEAAQSLPQEISAAESFEFSLGPRLPQEVPPTPAQTQIAELYTVNPEGKRPHGKPLFVLAPEDIPFQDLFSVGYATSEAGYGRLRVLSDLSLLRVGRQARAVELYFAKGEELAFVEKAPVGFPGGALIVVMQRGSVHAVLPPGLERLALSPAALTGFPPSPEGTLDPIPLGDFLMHFNAQKLIIAAAPNMPLKPIFQLIDGVKRKDPEAQILLTLAPEAGAPSWIATMPKSVQGSFSTLAPLEVIPTPP